MEPLKLATFGQNIVYMSIKITKAHNPVYITLGFIILFNIFLLLSNEVIKTF